MQNSVQADLSPIYLRTPSPRWLSDSGTNSLLDLLLCMRDYSHENTTRIQESFKYLKFAYQQGEDKHNTEILLPRQDTSGLPDSTGLLWDLAGAARTPPNKSHTSTTQQILGYLDFVRLLACMLYPWFSLPHRQRLKQAIVPKFLSWHKPEQI